MNNFINNVSKKYNSCLLSDQHITLIAFKISTSVSAQHQYSLNPDSGILLKTDPDPAAGSRPRIILNCKKKV